MKSHRDGQQVVVCDGCYRLIDGNPVVWAAKDGRKGDVHNDECGQKFALHPAPTDRREKSSTG